MWNQSRGWGRGSLGEGAVPQGLDSTFISGPCQECWWGFLRVMLSGEDKTELWGVLQSMGRDPLKKKKAREVIQTWFRQTSENRVRMSLTTRRGEAYWPVRTEGEKEALMEACSSGTKGSWMELGGGPKAVSDGLWRYEGHWNSAWLSILWGISSSPQDATDVIWSRTTFIASYFFSLICQLGGVHNFPDFPRISLQRALMGIPSIHLPRESPDRGCLLAWAALIKSSDFLWNSVFERTPSYKKQIQMGLLWRNLG